MLYDLAPEVLVPVLSSALLNSVSLLLLGLDVSSLCCADVPLLLAFLVCLSVAVCLAVCAAAAEEEEENRAVVVSMAVHLLLPPDR